MYKGPPGKKLDEVTAGPDPGPPMRGEDLERLEEERGGANNGEQPRPASIGDGDGINGELVITAEPLKPTPMVETVVVCGGEA